MASASSDQHYYLPAPQVVRALSFGFNELAADALWIRSIAYFADHISGDRDLRHLHRYLQTVIAQDPYFKAVYRYGSAMEMGLGDSTSNATTEHVAELLREGHRRFPNEQLFPLRLGTLYMYELRAKTPRERRRNRVEGARWLQRAILLGASAPWLAVLAAQVFSQEGEQELAILHLQEMILVTQDDATRQQLVAKLRRIQLSTQLNRLRRESRRLSEAHKKSSIPFVSADLYALIEQPPEAPTPLLGRPKQH